MKLTPEIKSILEKEGYSHLVEKDGKICGLMKFAFTLGLMVNITIDQTFGMPLGDYEFRFCYPYEKTQECLADLALYKYGQDPIGGWVKQKGSGIDRVNPVIEQEWIKNRE